MKSSYTASPHLKVSLEMTKDYHSIPKAGSQAVNEIHHPNAITKGNIFSCFLRSSVYGER